MPGDEKALLAEMAGKLGRLEAAQEASVRATSELNANINRLVDKLDNSDDVAKAADQRARSAHHRIDTVEKIMFWSGTTLIIGMAGIIWKIIWKGWGH